MEKLGLMAFQAITTVVVLGVLSLIPGSVEVNPEWGKPLDDVLTIRDTLILIFFDDSYTKEPAGLVSMLNYLVRDLEKFEYLDWTKEPEKIIDAALAARMKTKPEMQGKVYDILPSMKSKNKLDQLLPQLKTGKDLGLVCQGYQKNTYKFSTENICASAEECKKVEFAYRKMAAVLWHQIGAYLLERLCKRTEDAMVQDFQRVTKMIYTIGDNLISTFDWEGKSQEVYDLEDQFGLKLVIQQISIDEVIAKFGLMSCMKLQNKDFCPLGYIYQEYIQLVKLKRTRENRPSKRDLQRQGRVNHAKMLELKKEALDHLEVLAGIGDVDEDISQKVSDTAKYFETLGEYDERKADADVGFIHDKLDKFEERRAKLLEKFHDDFKNLLLQTDARAILSNMEKFLADDLDAFQGAPSTVIEIAKLGALHTKEKELYESTQKLAHNFALNAIQIRSLKSLVQRIKSKTVGDLGADEVADFIAGYGDYTPLVSESDLSRNNELWSAYKEAACEALNGGEEIISSSVSAIGLACEKLDGTLSDFFALREDMFDYQFDEVDALANVIRGYLSKKMAKNMRLDFSPQKRYTQWMLAYLKIQRRLQTEASVYCDKLEYINHGKSIHACSKTDFFTEKDLDDLIAYEPDSHYHVEERFVYIPTKRDHELHGDFGFIDLASLKEQRNTTFRLPANTTWLQKYNWLKSDEHLAPFVQSFKIYLPVKDYQTVEIRARHSKTRIQLTSSGRSCVDVSCSLSYLIPNDDSQYVTTYEQGYDQAKCPRGKEILNPYSLCENLPFLCDTTTRVQKSMIMPTILSKWEMKVSVESGAETLDWDVPDPATDFRIIAKVEIRLPHEHEENKRSRLHRRNEIPYGCCQRTQYRKDWGGTDCYPCPDNTESKMGGYYCEKKMIP